MAPDHFPTGVPFIDSRLVDGQGPGNAYGLLGPIGVGKTTLAIMLAVELARRPAANGKRMVAFFVTNDTTPTDLYVWSRSYTAEVSRSAAEHYLSFLHQRQGDLQGQCQNFQNSLAQDFDKLAAADNWLNDHLSIQNFSTARLRNDLDPATAIASEIERFCAHDNLIQIAGVVVDYVALAVRQYIDSYCGEEWTQSRLTKEFVATTIDLMAKRWECPVWLVQQLNGTANRKSPATPQSHEDAAGCRSFAERLTACFTLGQRDSSSRLIRFDCTKAPTQPPTLDPSLVEVDLTVARIAVNEEYRLDKFRKRFLRATRHEPIKIAEEIADWFD